MQETTVEHRIPGDDCRSDLHLSVRVGGGNPGETGDLLPLAPRTTKIKVLSPMSGEFLEVFS